MYTYIFTFLHMWNVTVKSTNEIIDGDVVWKIFHVVIVMAFLITVGIAKAFINYFIDDSSYTAIQNN